MTWYHSFAAFPEGTAGLGQLPSCETLPHLLMYQSIWPSRNKSQVKLANAAVSSLGISSSCRFRAQPTKCPQKTCPDLVGTGTSFPLTLRNTFVGQAAQARPARISASSEWLAARNAPRKCAASFLLLMNRRRKSRIHKQSQSVEGLHPLEPEERCVGQANNSIAKRICCRPDSQQSCPLLPS